MSSPLFERANLDMSLQPSLHHPRCLRAFIIGSHLLHPFLFYAILLLRPLLQFPHPSCVSQRLILLLCF
jgi:hypothetical protein